MKRLNIALILPVVFFVCVSSAIADKTGSSSTVPGRRVADYAIGMMAEEISGTEVNGCEVLNLNKEMVLYRDVFHVKVKADITFNMLWSCADGNFLLFMDKRVVCMIITETSEAWSGIPDLSKGIDFVVYTLGNDGLKVVREGKHFIYIFPGRGLAFLDDNGDDSIDLCIVFLPQ